MSPHVNGLYQPVLVRAAEAERLESIGHILLADSIATHGAGTAIWLQAAAGTMGSDP